MPATRRTCQYAGCNFGEDETAYTTMEGLQTHADVMKDLELHIAMTHAARGGDRGGAGPDVKPDKFPRPEITDLGVLFILLAVIQTCYPPHRAASS